jgi:hypothetical protein
MFVQQQLPATLGIVIEVAAMTVGIYVYVVEPDVCALHARKAVAEVGPALADALDLGAEQRNAGFERFEDVVVVKRLAVVGDRGFGVFGRWFLYNTEL